MISVIPHVGHAQTNQPARPVSLRNIPPRTALVYVLVLMGCIGHLLGATTATTNALHVSILPLNALGALPTVREHSMAILATVMSGFMMEDLPLVEHAIIPVTLAPMAIIMAARLVRMPTSERRSVEDATVWLSTITKALTNAA